MHSKAPVSISQIPNAVGLDAIIQKITGTLAGVPWIAHVYGRAWTQVTGLGDKPKVLPFAYSGKREYFGVPENDFLASQSFIKIDGPEKYPEGDVVRRLARTEANRQLSIIVWVNRRTSILLINRIIRTLKT